MAAAVTRHVFADILLQEGVRPDSIAVFKMEEGSL